MLSRRALGRGAVGLVGVTGAGLGYVWLGSGPALAIDDPSDWIANSASITTHDGSVSGVTFGDPDGITDSEDLEEGDDHLAVEWSGFNAQSRQATFNVHLSGTDGGDGGDWDGGDVTTGEEELATGSETLTGTSGVDSFTWNDVFGESQPVDVSDHTEIALSDFEADADGSTTERELEVRIEVVVPDEDNLTADKTATATISITNEAATIEVGGEGSFEITSDEEV
ncbi:hypothetical protein [Natrarchaeobius chitinivorans]|uniref:Uncharacterized protein n=1 Tax=Natrarchaeobius chitinivorans TaxID=1679083 RepID=A0A3N6M6U0_NATCH|nr:hypothetical protein [Natrarchaeobius chitinivorans]RQG91820.1 hypothetical protein EA473_18670 [Natrarchaeobius chitinivorans]